MQEKKGLSAEIIIVLIVIIAIVGFIVYSSLNKKVEIEYGTVEGSQLVDPQLIEDYKGLKKFISKARLGDDLIINFQHYSLLERYNEEYFETKKLGAIVINEDNSRIYTHGIRDIIYNEDRTSVTVKYEHKTGDFLEKLTRSWQTCMLVELDGTVTSADFQIDNPKTEKK